MRRSTLNVLSVAWSTWFGGGAAALALGSSGQRMVFQDLNAEVLQAVTAANVALNARDSVLPSTASLQQRITFVSGAWSQLPQVLKDTGQPLFDVILASEVLYNEEYYDDLMHVLDTLLAPDGVCVIATKRFYFGVGGGTLAFEQALQHHGRLASSTDSAQIQTGSRPCRWSLQRGAVYEDGRSNLREIVVLTREV